MANKAIQLYAKNNCFAFCLIYPKQNFELSIKNPEDWGR